MKLKLNLLGHLRMLSYTIVMSLAITILLWYSPNYNINLFYLIGPYLLIFVIPVLYIHLNYYSKNNGVTFIISKEGIIKEKAGKQISYGITDFENIEFAMTGRRMYHIPRGSFPFENYYYARIRLKNSENIIITSLYPKNIEEILKSTFINVPIEFTRTFYPLIY